MSWLLHFLNVRIPLCMHWGLHSWSGGPGAECLCRCWGVDCGVDTKVSRMGSVSWSPDAGARPEHKWQGALSSGRNCKPRRVSVIFCEKVREGLWEEAPCELGLTRAERAEQSGQGAVRWAREAHACVQGVLKRGWQGWEGIGVHFWRNKLRRLVKDSPSVSGPAAPVCPGSWLDMLILQPLPGPLNQNL